MVVAGCGSEHDAPRVDASTGETDALVDSTALACRAPVATPTVALHDIWQANPSIPTAYWIPGLYVTGVSATGCAAVSACDLYVQQAETFASVAVGAQQSIRITVGATEAQGFVGIGVGDRIDVYGHGVRETANGKNELILSVCHARRSHVVGLRGHCWPLAG